MSASTSVLVPLKLDAFILNQSSCESDDYKIAPISQPNYTFLRLGLKDYLLHADILDPVDLHAAKPSSINSRVTDLGSGRWRNQRLGVYLHWVLPPFYRAGVGTAVESNVKNPQANNDATKEQAGYPSRSTADPNLQGSAADPSAPDFRPVPNRWLVTRRLKPKSYSPPDANIPLFQSWVIQSDAKRRLSDEYNLPDTDPKKKANSLIGKDLEVDVSPFVDSTMLTKDGKVVDDIITSQAEVFVGKKTDFDSWVPADADTDECVDLNIMTSANPLLPDYQIHNGNIFSMLDNFQYTGKDNKPANLDWAQADYSVIGWHAKDDDDPMTTSSSVPDGQVPSHSTRLDNCKMQLKDYNSDPSQVPAGSWMKDAASWLQKEGGRARSDARILCHSAMYDVLWNSKKLPTHIGARDAGQIQKSMSFAVGTSALDALVAYFEALATNNPSLQDVKNDLLRLIHILGEAGDGNIDSLQKFSDEAYKLTFKKFDAGTQWFWKTETGANDAPAQASLDDINNLDQLNANQAALENLKRELSECQWKLFAIWWTRASSFEVQNLIDEYKGNPAKNKTGKLEALLNRMKTLGTSTTANGSLLKDLQGRVQGGMSSSKHSKGSAANFYQRKDPTLLFCGIEPGWEPDFSGPVQVRLQGQTIRVDPKEPVDGDWAGYATRFQDFSKKAPGEVQAGVQALLKEFYALRSTRSIAATPDPLTQVLPYFHETKRDLFQDTQPWRPLFIEWEALYYHIPYEKWTWNEYQSANRYGAHEIQYSVTENASKVFASQSLEERDVIHISGRNYLQPQSQSMFKTMLQQVFQNTNPDDLADEFGVTKDDQQTMLDVLSAGKFVSASLTSITNSLLTMKEGTHLKPLIRVPNSQPVAMQQAVDTFSQICPPGFGDARSILQLIDDQGNLTPFASSVPISKNAYPFKPVQHGQLQFIKINIIDKFGQAVHVIDPTPPAKGVFNTTNPVISRSLFVGTIDDKDGKGVRPNTALLQPDKQRDACPFISLPPSINQPARINSVFVHKVKDPKTNAYKWQRTSDWDNPVWGWVVVNYADSGIQFFLENGEFYREVRFGSRAGTSTSYKYLPFDPPATPAQSSSSKQLDFLIAKLQDPKYLLAFWDMINTSFASGSFEHAPTSYASFSSAIIGKPLALVNTGWSLQLAHPPRENWTTSPITNPDWKPPRTLLNPDEGKRWAARQWDAASADKSGYTFHLKLGDHSRRYDGLVGYFLPSQQALGANTSDLDLGTIYTFNSFISQKQSPDPRTAINTGNYPKHTPYWFAPGAAGEALDQHDDKLQVVSMLMDPFLPVHAFSAILPTQALQIPPRTVELALKQMTAFWHAGPLLTPADLDFTRPVALDASYASTLAKHVSGTPLDTSKTGTPGNPDPKATAAALPTVGLPLSPPVGAANGGAAKFVWLQPYLVDITSPDGKKKTKTSKFTAFGIDERSAAGADAQEAKLSAGPYTAVEGYVQIAKDLSGDFVGG